MKPAIVFSFLFVLFFVSFSVYAQEETVPTTPDERGRAEAREERRGMLETKMQERVINLTANVTLRLRAMLDRMGNIVSRLDTRIEKLKASGIDTEAAEEKLSLAKRLLVETEIAIEELPSVERAVVSEAPRELFRMLREDMLTIKENLRTVHGYLRETVALLKDGVREGGTERGVSEAVSSTTTPTPSSMEGLNEEENDGAQEAEMNQ